MTDSSVRTPRRSEAVVGPRMPVPAPRGPISAELIDMLTGYRSRRGPVRAIEVGRRPEILADDDAQISLALLYELHLRGVDGVPDEAGWDLDLLALRAALERELVAGLDDRIGEIDDPGDVVAALFAVAARDDGPPIARHLARSGTIEEFRELVVHRSLNQLREADLHTFAIPRLHGAAKAAMVEVQSDEYGGGLFDHMHAELFAELMRGLDLDATYARYVDQVPATTLAALNTLSYFGMHRARLYELVGHLCLVETTSSLPSRDYSRALRRLGIGRSARLFYDEHVEADAVHEQLVVRKVAGVLGTTPSARIGLMRGAMACAVVERIALGHVWTCWQAGRSSLRGEVVR